MYARNKREADSYQDLKLPYETEGRYKVTSVRREIIDPLIVSFLSRGESLLQLLPH